VGSPVGLLALMGEEFLCSFHANSMRIEFDLTIVQRRSNQGEPSEEGLPDAVVNTLSLVKVMFEHFDFGEEVLFGHNKPFVDSGLITNRENCAKQKEKARVRGSS
jgi:hypothetical protein